MNLSLKLSLCKRNKCVCPLPTMHSNPLVDETSKKGKPEVILEYNKNKLSWCRLCWHNGEAFLHTFCVFWHPRNQWLYNIQYSSRREALKNTISDSSCRSIYLCTQGVPAPNWITCISRWFVYWDSKPTEEMPSSIRLLKFVTICQRCCRATCGRCAVENSRVIICSLTVVYCKSTFPLYKMVWLLICEM